MNKKLGILAVAVVLVALIVAQADYVSARQPEYLVFKASMKGEPSGPPTFTEDGEGEMLFYWDASYKLPVIAEDDPQPVTQYGFLSSLPGRPPICVCPNNDESCHCTFTPPGGVAVNLRRN